MDYQTGKYLEVLEEKINNLTAISLIVLKKADAAEYKKITATSKEKE